MFESFLNQYSEFLKLLTVVYVTATQSIICNSKHIVFHIVFRQSHLKVKGDTPSCG